MKIAIYHNLPSGGGKRALYEMTRRLAERHTIDVFSLSCAEHDFCDLRPLVAAHKVYEFQAHKPAKSPFGRINPLLRRNDLLRLEDVQKEIARHIDEGGYDLVFAHACQIGQSPAILKYLKTPSFYYCAEPPRFLYEPQVRRPISEGRDGLRLFLDRYDPLIKSYRRAYLNLDRQNTLAAGQVLTNSIYSRESLHRIYGIQAKVCYLGVDFQRFERKKLAKENFIMSVGALNSIKGFEDVIRATGKVDTGIRPAVVIVANQGNGSEERFLKELAESCEVVLRIQVRVKDEELVELYNRALFTAYLPILEPFGFVPLESMACGTPVIGVQEGGVRESVVDGVSGYLVERQPEAIARKMTCLLTDSDLRHQMGEAGRAHVLKNWTWERTITSLEEIFHSGVPA